MIALRVDIESLHSNLAQLVKAAAADHENILKAGENIRELAKIARAQSESIAELARIAEPQQARPRLH